LNPLNRFAQQSTGECIGIARNALMRAAQYANERVVFDRPIGQNQGVQHPLAQAWAQVEAANLMVMHAAALYDEGEACGVEANAAKPLAADAAVETTEAAQITFGGFGYAKNITWSVWSERRSCSALYP